MAKYLKYALLDNTLRSNGITVTGDTEGATVSTRKLTVALRLSRLTAVAINAHYDSAHGYTVGFGTLPADKVEGEIASLANMDFGNEKDVAANDAAVCDKFLDPIVITERQKVPYWGVPPVKFSDVVKETEASEEEDVDDDNISDTVDPVEYVLVLDSTKPCYRLVDCAGTQRKRLIGLARRSGMSATTHHSQVAVCNADSVLVHALPPNLAMLQGGLMPSMTVKHGAAVVSKAPGVVHPAVVERAQEDVGLELELNIEDGKISDPVIDAFVENPSEVTKLDFLTNTVVRTASRMGGRLGSNKKRTCGQLIRKLQKEASGHPVPFTLADLVRESTKIHPANTANGIKLLVSACSAIRGSDATGYTSVQ